MTVARYLALPILFIFFLTFFFTPPSIMALCARTDVKSLCHNIQLEFQDEPLLMVVEVFNSCQVFTWLPVRLHRFSDNNALPPVLSEYNF